MALYESVVSLWSFGPNRKCPRGRESPLRLRLADEEEIRTAASHLSRISANRRSPSGWRNFS